MKTRIGGQVESLTWKTSHPKSWRNLPDILAHPMYMMNITTTVNNRIDFLCRTVQNRMLGPRTTKRSRSNVPQPTLVKRRKGMSMDQQQTTPRITTPTVVDNRIMSKQKASTYKKRPRNDDPPYSPYSKARPGGKANQDQMTIMSWNVRSLAAKYEEKYPKLDSLIMMIIMIKPDVVFLQETWMEKDEFTKLLQPLADMGYHLTHSAGRVIGGGMGILTKKIWQRNL